MADICGKRNRLCCRREDCLSGPEALQVLWPLHSSAHAAVHEDKFFARKDILSY